MPYYIRKRFEVAGAHQLSLDYESPCGNLHGHNWKITVYCRCEDGCLDKNGMIIDFKRIKEVVSKQMDHRFLNDLVDFNPTAENIARWICDQISECYRVDVEESENNTAVYIRPGVEDVW